ncbi:hypothetical protein I7I48_11449 [Histoplasma ohiense]|nr:hypothetical protein I7I48_11449 [Histoplasma ohiense (nom. inval.)]
MAEAHAQLFFFTQIKANPNSTIRILEISHAWKSPVAWSMLSRSTSILSILHQMSSDPKQ